MATRTLHRRPVAWPIRLLAWLIRATLVLIITAVTVVIAVAVGASIYYELSRTKAGDLDEMIEKQLPNGVSADAIYTVLDARGIEHGAAEPSPGDDVRLLEAGVTKGTMVISAIVRNEGHTVEHVDVEMKFVLDENGKLKEHLVYEVHHRPDWLDLDFDAPKE